MTVASAEKWVARIGRMAGDDESAHSEEDRFHRAVLREIAKGHADSRELARIALTTDKIAFARWCA